MQKFARTAEIPTKVAGFTFYTHPVDAGVAHVNEVTRHRARLVLRCVKNVKK